MEKIDEELKQLGEERAALTKRWEEEKGILTDLQSARQQIEDFKNQAAMADRSGDYGRVAELRYGKIAQAQQKIDELTARQSAIKDPIITEAVTPEDIAEVVARWTGIPVSRNAANGTSAAVETDHFAGTSAARAASGQNIGISTSPSPGATRWQTAPAATATTPNPTDIIMFFMFVFSFTKSSIADFQSSAFNL